MPRFRLPFTPRTVVAFVLGASLIAIGSPRVTQAAGSKQLQRVAGTVGWATVADASDFKQVFGKFDLPDPDYAVTRAQSKAVLAMPDSSLISLGENTSVQVGEFDNASASPGAQIRINGGSMRFDIKRPEGGTANYRFVTPTSQTAVRGTIGLISFVNGITTVGCVVCAADSVVVTVGTQTFALATGQFLAVSALGAVTTGAITGATAAFGAAGVPTTATSGAVAAGIPAAGSAVIIPAAAAAAAGVAAGVAASQPKSDNDNADNAAPNATPTGTVNLTNRSRTQAAPAPIPTPATAHTPIPVPQARPTVSPGPGRPGIPGGPGRFGR